ncbi:Eco57I restriction-modification methylase domain-containing protein [Methanobacterium spitsbergense]|uniref:site-specific DNA-methyltransferase (adenine-specific) n=1 Tax=Methanobacterium spitsbergense TaxID=2874285 RepID=A0A8T5V4N7_9EURY|nr:TaqI-like C-terminal specificity domain-containing protein [Methanobacterium spitsbergense]MBZ2166635.1 N-6 DNA methylase [Methanobacterium spitsbergense]
MKNNLFNQDSIKKYTNNFILTEQKQKRLKRYIERVQNNEFKGETKGYPAFLKFLEDILDYEEDKHISFDDNVDIGSDRVEFALKDNDGKFMVIELKGQNADLDKPQNRANDKRTPVEQAFGYAQHSSKKSGLVQWILVSNYKEFRLYNYEKRLGEYISFNVEDLLNEDEFKYFMFAFSKESHVDLKAINDVVNENYIEKTQLANNFYNLFNETRLMIFKELHELHRMDKNDAISNAQTILDRFIFISFSSSRNLLPPDIARNILLDRIKSENIRDHEIWRDLNYLFIDVNEGNKDRNISEYNGGLFKEDLTDIKLKDIINDKNFFKDVYQKWNFKEFEDRLGKEINKSTLQRINPIYINLLIISYFDFSEENKEDNKHKLDIEILGHIFENSIGDIEELKEDSKGRRKKEGIFYTPDYITDYICKNTIIPYLGSSGNVNTVDELLKEFSAGREVEKLDEKLKNIKIIDPACGSGAFLNKATDILLDIHKGIFKIKKGYKTSIPMRVGKGKGRKTENVQHMDIGVYVFDALSKRREILLDNIYGVDLNSESVEITKLSLFLKVCEKGKKLPKLDNNIKCGNSLIDDSDFTDKPFKWEEEFPEIFNNGGFDIVIGNPPYGIFIDEYVMNYYSTHFPLTQYKMNLYILFIERMLQIFNNSIVHFIIPKSLLFNSYHGMLRKELLLKTEINEIFTITEKVFADAEVGGSLLLKFTLNDTPNPENNIKLRTAEKVQNVKMQSGIKENYIPQEYFLSIPNYEISFLSSSSQVLLTKLLKLKTIHDFYILKNGLNPGNIKHILISNKKETSFFKPIIWGRDITRYDINWSGQYVNYDKRITSTISIADLQSKPGMKKQNKVDLRWRTPDIFENEKIVIRKTGDSLICCYDDKNFYFDTLVHGIYLKDKNFSLKFLMAILNSYPATYFYRLLHDIKGKIFAKISLKNLGMFPLPEIGLDEQQPFIERADIMLHLNRQLQNEINGFKYWIQKEFHVEKLSKKLEKYYELSKDEFIIEMRKKKVNTKSRKNREYLEREFSESIKITNPLLQEIELTNNEIDQMVYKLYRLTDDEIKIIEDSV